MYGTFNFSFLLSRKHQTPETSSLSIHSTFISSSDDGKVMDNFGESYYVLIIWKSTIVIQKYCGLFLDDFWKPVQGRNKTQCSFLN